MVAVERVQRLLERYPSAERQLFTQHEIGVCRRGPRSDERFAARFAGKEALLKALGAPHGQILRLTEVEIREGAMRRPEVRLHGRLTDWAAVRGVASAEVSLSHDAGVAAAYAAVSWQTTPPAPRWFAWDELPSALRYARAGAVALHRFRWDLRRFGLGADESACHVLCADVAVLIRFGAAFGLPPGHLQPPPPYRPGIWHFDAFGGVLERLEAAHPAPAG